MEKTGQVAYAKLAALSWRHQRPCIGSQLPLRLRLSPFETSPAGVEGRSCFIDGTDYLKQQCFAYD